MVAEIVGSMKRTRQVERGLVALVLVGFSCLFILPFLITLSDALKGMAEVYAVPRIWIPETPRFDNFVKIFQVLPFHRFFVNTAAITVLCIIGELSSACLVGYSFARMRWPFRDTLFVVLLSTMMLPGQVTLIPTFLLFNWLGWVNTWLPLIVPGYFARSVFNVFLLRQFFKTVPLALEDAARIDGCSHFRILTTIMVPLAKPAIATLLVLNFISQWNDFMGPLIYLSDYVKYPISMGIYMFMSVQSSSPHFVMAASLVSLVPVLILFFSAQRYFVKGIALTGIKG